MPNNFFERLFRRFRLLLDPIFQFIRDILGFELVSPGTRVDSIDPNRGHKGTLVTIRGAIFAPGLPRAIYFALICCMPSSVYMAASDGAVFEAPAGIHLYAMFVGLLRLLAASLLFHISPSHP